MVWWFIWPAPHPKYVHPPGTPAQFLHLWIYGHFGQIFFKISYAPNEVIYTSVVFGKESQVLKASFYAFLGQTFFLKILRLIPKGPRDVTYWKN